MPGRFSASLSRFKRHLILGNGLILAVVVLVALLDADASHRAHEARARQTAANLAQTLSLSVDAGFKLVDNTLQSTLKRLDEVQARGTSDPAALARIEIGRAHV